MPHRLPSPDPTKERIDLFRADWDDNLRSAVPVGRHRPAGASSRLRELFAPGYWTAPALRQQFDPLLVGAAESTVSPPRVGITVCSTIPMHAVDGDYFGHIRRCIWPSPCAARCTRPAGLPAPTAIRW